MHVRDSCCRGPVALAAIAALAWATVVCGESAPQTLPANPSSDRTVEPSWTLPLQSPPTAGSLGSGPIAEGFRDPPLPAARVRVVEAVATGRQSPAAVNGPPIALVELESLAEVNHPAIRAAAEEVRVAEGQAWQAGLYPNPQVAVSSPQLAGSDSQYNVFLSQDLVTGGKLRLDVAAAQRRVAQAELSLVRARFDVLTALRQRFYDTLAAQVRVDVLEHLVDIARRAHDTSRKLLEAGEGARPDVLLLGIELNKAEMALANARVQVEIGRRQLALAAGVPEMPVGPLSGRLDAPLPHFDVMELERTVAARHAEAQRARVEVGRAQVALRRAEVEPLPDVNLMGGYQNQVEGVVENQGLFQVAMTWPLWNRNQGNIRAAEAGIRSALAQSRRVELDLAGRAASALASYRVSQQQVERFERDILPGAREALRLAQLLYQQGETGVLNLLAAERTLVEADLSYVDAQRDRWAALAELAGLLQEEAFP